jgi:uncharacterized damage-inducible protein DinB
MHDGIQFSDLLAYTEAEHARSELVFHIFVVNLFFAHRLLGLDLLDFKRLPHSSLEELFAVDQDASLRTFLEKVRTEDWETKLPLGFIDRSVSKRKMLSQAMLHGVHHRAQLATALRQQGLKQDWKHDLILSDVME